MTDPIHLAATILDGYLHHTLTPAHHNQVRTHLDTCHDCWNTWNRHRWDAAATNPLHAQLAEFLGDAFRPYFDSSQALATEWNTADPRTAHDAAQFFRTSTSYLYNLTIWEASGNRPAYLSQALPTLNHQTNRTVLDYECGIGSDTIPLQHHGFTVTACDFHSPSTAFLRHRSHNTIPVIEPDELATTTPPGILWIIDTLDHIPDIETTLGPTLSAINLMITENLTTNRGHGRQPFHIRRPPADLTTQFANHGLTPTAHNQIMIWTRSP